MVPILLSLLKCAACYRMWSILANDQKNTCCAIVWMKSSKEIHYCSLVDGVLCSARLSLILYLLCIFILVSSVITDYVEIIIN